MVTSDSRDHANRRTRGCDWKESAFVYSVTTSASHSLSRLGLPRHVVTHPRTTVLDTIDTALARSRFSGAAKCHTTTWYSLIVHRRLRSGDGSIRLISTRNGRKRLVIKMISGLLGSRHGWFSEFSETAVNPEIGETEEARRADSRMIDGWIYAETVLWLSLAVLLIGRSLCRWRHLVVKSSVRHDDRKW